MQPQLSVIIPTFNRPAETRRAVASACASAPEAAEILVIDDGSPTAISALSSDSRVRVIRHAANRGAAAARNTGLEAARGEWIAFLDSDDTWNASAFAERWRAAQSVPPLTVAVCGFTHIDASTGQTRTRHPRPSRDPLWFASGCWFCPGSTALFRRRPVLEAIGPQDETLRRLEDLDWFLRLALAGGGVEVTPVVGAFIARGANPSRAALEDAIAVLSTKYREQPPALRRRLKAYAHLERAACYWREGRRAAALTQALQAWWAKPRLQAQLEDFWSSNASSSARQANLVIENRSSRAFTRRATSGETKLE